MRDPKLKNIPASIRQKLLNLARDRNDDFRLILTKYGLERILFRLSKSEYQEVFILKGALLFELWTEQRYRPTRDADFLAKVNNSPQRFVRIFQDISTVEVENDGLRFDPKTVKAERIKEDAEYEGVRVGSPVPAPCGCMPFLIASPRKRLPAFASNPGTESVEGAKLWSVTVLRITPLLLADRQRGATFFGP